MAKIKVNIRKAIAEFFRRIRANENGVKSFLAKAGIQKENGKDITVADLKTLRDLNQEAFNDMVVYLYPELFTEYANGDGKKTGTGDSVQVEMSDEDKAGIFSLVSGLIDTAGSVLIGVYGHQDVSGVQISSDLAHQEAERTRRTLIIVCVFSGLLILGGFIILMRRTPGMNITKV